MNRYKLLIVYDVHVDTPRGRLMWAFARRAEALKKYAPDDFEVTIAPFRSAPWANCGQFDLVFNLEMAQPNAQVVKRERNVPLVVSWNADSNRRSEMWQAVTGQADFTICNNLDVFESHGRQVRTCCISNGVDTDIWRPIVPIEDRPHRVLWAGSSNPRKGKGYAEILQPLEPRLRELGFETDFRPINNITPELVKTTDDMVEWYNSGSYVVCASVSEGTPGIVSEGAACGCVAVTTGVGNVLEWGADDVNCVLCERTVDSFLEGLVRARESRRALSETGAAVFRQFWSYGPPGNRAQYFYGLFRRLIRGELVAPFSYAETDWRSL